MNVFPDKILLATDGSADAALAARVAMDLSNTTGTDLHVVHAWQADFPKAYAVTTPHTIIDWCEERAGELLAKEVEQIETAGGNVAETHLAMGRPVDMILNLAGELGSVLVVIGSRGLGPVKNLLLGSVSEGVVHHARSPVLVVRGKGSAWPPERVIIGDDDSEMSRRAGALAAEIAKPFGASAVLVRAYPEMPEIDVEGRASNQRLVDDALRRAERDLMERANTLESILGKHPRVRLVVGDAAAAILEICEEGEESYLIAVGARGLGPIGRMRLGSVSTKVLRAARGPVLVYPHEAV
ncbi:MAG TPA: universal stress protein [Rubrobacteraceae bacterium]|nr:universal stress protein [Rubrobacteraceae bacterium]